MYGQRNYPQTVGLGQLTISEGGSFLTAFANLLNKLTGSEVDPATLNQFFIDHQIYLSENGNPMQELAWASVCAYDGSISVVEVGSGPVPTSEKAIVKFFYTSPHTGLPAYHYSVVDKIMGDGKVFIIDSNDGITKSPDGYEAVYGKPIAWATYSRTVPPAEVVAEEPEVVSTSILPPIKFNSPPYKKIVRDIPGYQSITDLEKKQNALTVKAGEDYFRYDSSRGFDNVTLVSGQPGAWIDPADNAYVPLVAPQTSTVPTETESLEVTEPVVPKWQRDFMPHNETFIAQQDYLVSDLSGQEDPKPLKVGWAFPSSGTFEEDGITYARAKNFSGHNYWYAVPLFKDGKPYTINGVRVVRSVTEVEADQKLRQEDDNDISLLEQLGMIIKTIQKAIVKTITGGK